MGDEGHGRSLGDRGKAIKVSKCVIMREKVQACMDEDSSGQGRMPVN